MKTALQAIFVATIISVVCAIGYLGAMLIEVHNNHQTIKNVHVSFTPPSK